MRKFICTLSLFVVIPIAVVAAAIAAAFGCMWVSQFCPSIPAMPKWIDVAMQIVSGVFWAAILAGILYVKILEPWWKQCSQYCARLRGESR